MTMTPNIEELVRLLTLQCAEHRKLRTLTERQRVAVREDDPHGLMQLLGERQRIVDDLQGINLRLAPYRDNWVTLYNGLDHGTRDCVKVTLEESNKLLAAVMLADEQDSEILGLRRRAMAATLAVGQTGGRAARAYAAEDAIHTSGLAEACA